MPRFDAIVVGLGGMGSAALYQLARRGVHVLGLERFGIPHDRGSSHGHTRIIRLAYWEHRAYVPLLRRAYALWRELEEETGERLLVITGSIDAAPRSSRVMEGVLDACSRFGLAHDRLDGRSLAARYPGYRLPDTIAAVYQPDGGYLLSERGIVQHVTQAQRAGAVVRTGEQVVGWSVDGTTLRIRTDRDRYECARLVVTAGPWTHLLPPGVSTALTPERQVVLWTRPLVDELFRPDMFPVFYMHVPEGSFYGFPDVEGRGFKIGKYHHLGEQVDPDTVTREATERDEAVLREAIARYFPAAGGPTLALKVCLFTNTPDEHFVIDLLRDEPRAAMAAGFSGHGYKFCSVVGEILADLALEGRTAHDISLFSRARFGHDVPETGC